MSSADTELAALDTIVRTLNSLDREQLTRVLSYVRSRYAPGSNGEDALGNGRTKAVQPQIRARHTGGENLVTTV